MTGAAQEMIGKIGYSVRFQDGGKKEILSNQLTIAIFKSELEEEIEVRELEVVPEVGEELGCYHWVYIYLNFIK